MSLRTWWLENKLRGIDGKLRRLRFAQKRLREKERTLDEARLHAERDALARSIAALVEDEHRVKQELRRLGVSLTSH